MDDIPQEKTVRSVKRTIIAKKKVPPPLGITRNGRPRKKTGRKIDPAEQEKLTTALELRTGGVTYREIAGIVGWTDASHAKRKLDKFLSTMEIDAAKEVVALDLARLEEYMMRCTYALRNDGDLHQIDRLMRIMEMRYRLLGINDETVRALQADHGIHRTINNVNNVQVVMASPETEDEFLRKMMGAVGVDPDSVQANEYRDKLRNHRTDAHTGKKILPMLERGNENADTVRSDTLEDSDVDEIFEAEIVEEI
jgi:hypothetical protein